MSARLVAASILCGAVCASGAWAGEKLNGYAEYRQGRYMIIDGQRVYIDNRTDFEGLNKARSFRATPLGYEVRVKGRRQDDGSILATKVEAQKNREEEIERELKKGFDKIEAEYRRHGRMVETDSKGRVIADLGNLHQHGAQVDRVRRIMSNLVPSYVDPEDLRVYVVENEDWNAMAAPNYSVFVFSGLLDVLDDDEIAIVLGHELAHATHEHSRKQYKQGTWVQWSALAASLLAGETIGSDTAAMAADLGTQLAASAIAKGYSRDHEDQADRVGMRYAYEAGYDVTKAPGLWAKFAEKYGETSKTVNFFFGEHSRSSKRAELLEAEIDNNYRDPDPEESE